jgi:hypothetical protein
MISGGLPIISMAMHDLKMISDDVDGFVRMIFSWALFDLDDLEHTKAFARHNVDMISRVATNSSLTSHNKKAMTGIPYWGNTET